MTNLALPPKFVSSREFVLRYSNYSSFPSRLLLQRHLNFSLNKQYRHPH